MLKQLVFSLFFLQNFFSLSELERIFRNPSQKNYFFLV